VDANPHVFRSGSLSEALQQFRMLGDELVSSLKERRLWED
jgi:hypothetical protein